MNAWLYTTLASYASQDKQQMQSLFTLLIGYQADSYDIHGKSTWFLCF